MMGRSRPDQGSMTIEWCRPRSGYSFAWMRQDSACMMASRAKSWSADRRRHTDDFGSTMAKPIGLAPQEQEQPQEEAKAQVGRGAPNLLEAFYANLSEKTMQESSLYGDSQYKPYNPDPIVKKDQAYRIYEDMLDDDQVDVALQLKKDLVLGSGWKISEAPPQIEQDLVAALDDEPDRDLESQIEEILTAYEFGFSVSEKVFKKREDGTL